MNWLTSKQLKTIFASGKELVEFCSMIFFIFVCQLQFEQNCLLCQKLMKRFKYPPLHDLLKM